MQFGGVLSTSHVANNFMGTGLLPPIGGGLLAFSAMFSRTEKNIWTGGIPVAVQTNEMKSDHAPTNKNFS